MSVRGFTWVLCLVCYTTGKVWLYPCRSRWVEEVCFWLDIHQQAVPSEFAIFLTDNAGELSGVIAEAYHKIFNRDLIAGPVRTPRARGKVEVKNKFAESLLARLCVGWLSNWRCLTFV